MKGYRVGDGVGRGTEGVVVVPPEVSNGGRDGD